MIIKKHKICIFILVMLLLSSCCYTLNKNSEPIVDINNRIIVYKVDGNKICYIKEDGKRINAYNGVEFNGGRDSLNILIDSIYYNNPDYHKYGESNRIEVIFILFDNDLNIEEVRIMHRIPEAKLYYDDLFINALKNTNGRWYKTIENKKYYCYLINKRLW